MEDGSYAGTQIRTLENKVSFLLLLVTMDTKGRPPVE